MLQNVMKRKTDIHPRLFTPLLTQREKEIITLMAQELTIREISEKLFISYDTAENHRYNLIQKLDVKNAEGLVKTAKYMGLI
jgi:DNA-binding CsgD family transcriptional regulator